MVLKIKELRNKKKLTQDEVSDKSGIKKRTYIDYESGKTDVPLSKLQNIAIALGVTIYDLIDNENVSTFEEPKSTYGKEEKNEPSLLIKNNSLLKEQNQLQEELIIMLREKVQFTEEKLQQCENEKKIFANSKEID